MDSMNVTCLSCGLDAPGVGVGGHLGTPSLSAETPGDLAQVDGEELPFGFLYEPLRAICLQPRDLEEMREFLSTHEGHRLVMWSDSQDTGDWPLELVALQARREAQRAKRVDAADEADDITCVADVQDQGWVFGHYEASCLDCRNKQEIDEPETLRAFDPQLLSRKAVGLMLSRWGKLAPDDGWNHALRPAVDPYGPCIEELLKFLKRHRAHRLEARLRPVGR